MQITAKTMAPVVIETLKVANPVFAEIRAIFDKLGEDMDAHELVWNLTRKSIMPTRCVFANLAYGSGMNTADAEGWADAEIVRLTDLTVEELTGITLTGEEPIARLAVSAA